MAIAFVQSVFAGANGASDVTTASFSTTTGNLLHADAFNYDQQGAYSSVISNGGAGSTFTPNGAEYDAVQVHTHGGYARLRSARLNNITGSGSESVQYNLTGGGYPTVVVAEISGQDATSPLDIYEPSTILTDFTTGAASYTTSASSSANGIAFAGFVQDNSGQVYSVGSGWTLNQSQGSFGTQPLTQYKAISGTGTITAPVGTTATGADIVDLGVLITSYKEAGGGGGTTTITMAQASWLWTGQAANLNRKTILTLALGAWVWTGRAATIDARRILTLVQGAWAWAGQAATIDARTVVTLAQAAWVWTGRAVGINAKTILTLAQSAWVWTGRAATIVSAGAIIMALAAWTWTGRAAAFNVKRIIALAQASWLWAARAIGGLGSAVYQGLLTLLGVG